MNDYQIASVVFALKLLQRVCPKDTYEQHVAHDVAFSALWLLPPPVAQIVEQMEAAT